MICKLMAPRKILCDEMFCLIRKKICSDNKLTTRITIALRARTKDTYIEVCHHAHRIMNHRAFRKSHQQLVLADNKDKCQIVLCRNETRTRKMSHLQYKYIKGNIDGTTTNIIVVSPAKITPKQMYLRPIICKKVLRAQEINKSRTGWQDNWPFSISRGFCMLLLVKILEHQAR